MKRFILGLLFFTSTTAIAATADTVAGDIELTIEHKIPVEQKVVEIHMYRNETKLPELRKSRRTEKLPFAGEHSTCSGSFISNMGDILTARHCVEGVDRFEVFTYDKRKYTAVVVATSSVHDLAIIHIDRRNSPFMRLADGVTRGEKIFVLGSPLGITDTLSTGIVARLDGDSLLIDCSALPGNSGGPVYNENEELVGVLSAGYIVFMGTTHLNVAQSLDAVYYFVMQFYLKHYVRD